MSSQHRVIKVSFSGAQCYVTRWLDNPVEAAKKARALVNMDPPFLVGWTIVPPVGAHEKETAKRELNEYLTGELGRLIDEMTRSSFEYEVPPCVECFDYSQNDWLWGVIDFPAFLTT